MTITDAFDAIEHFGYFPSLHGNTIYVDVKEGGTFLFYIELEKGKVRKEKLEHLLETCQLS